MKKKKIEKEKEDEQDSKTEDESNLEEEIEEIESHEEEKTPKKIIKDNEFHSFMKSPTESFSSVLEPVKIPQQESLEQNVGSAPIIQEKDEKLKDYKTEYKDVSEEYKKNENLLSQVEPTKINLDTSMEQNFKIAPEVQELRRKSEGTLEKDYVVKIGDSNEFKTKSLIEQQEKKYDFR